MKKVEKFMYPWSEQSRIVKLILSECFKRDLSKIYRNSAIFGIILGATISLPSIVLSLSGINGVEFSIINAFLGFFIVPLIVLSQSILFIGINRSELELGINQVLSKRNCPFRLKLSRGWFYYNL